MLFSYNLLQQFFIKKLPTPEKLGNLLTMHSFEVEGVQKKNGDSTLDVKILAHRGDCTGHAGLAREISAITGFSIKPEKMAKIQTHKDTLPQLKVKLQSPDIQRYSAIVVKDISQGASPRWMQEYLHALGMNSINSVVDITNYIMAELGQPLHAFDFDKIQGSTMTIRESRNQEKLITLDETEFKLPQGVLVIQDASRLIDLAGIKGGKLSAIGTDTKNVVFQAAVFNGSKIYETKKKLSYSSSAADIYARGIDQEQTMHALERVTALLKECGGGTIIQIIDLYPKKVKQRTVSLPFSMIESYLGEKITATKARHILTSLGFKAQGTSLWKVQIPSYRKDVCLPQDLVEEIGRIHGYENIKASLPVLSIKTPDINTAQDTEVAIQNALCQAGFSESYIYSFIGEKDCSLFSYSDKQKEELIRLQNPMSEDCVYLRPGLLENLLKSASANAKQMQDDICLFEIGAIFKKTSTIEIKETKKVSGVVVGNEAFKKAKGALEYIFSQLQIAEHIWYSQEEPQDALWAKSKTSYIMMGKTKIGALGMLSESIKEKLKIQNPVAMFGVDLASLLEHSKTQTIFQPISKYPPVLRDLAVLVPNNIKVEEAKERIISLQEPLLSSVVIFDTYEGKGVPEGKKNLAFHLSFLAKDRTLSSKEADEALSKIIKALESILGWTIRK